MVNDISSCGLMTPWRHLINDHSLIAAVLNAHCTQFCSHKPKTKARVRMLTRCFSITSWTRSSQASWKWVPKRRPAPPWSAGSTEVRPRQTRNIDPVRFISGDLDLKKLAKSAWNRFLYAFAVISLAPWMNTLPLLYAGDVLSITASGTCVDDQVISLQSLWKWKLRVYLVLFFAKTNRMHFIRSIVQNLANPLRSSTKWSETYQSNLWPHVVLRSIRSCTSLIPVQMARIQRMEGDRRSVYKTLDQSITNHFLSTKEEVQRLTIAKQWKHNKQMPFHCLVSEFEPESPKLLFQRVGPGR